APAEPLMKQCEPGSEPLVQSKPGSAGKGSTTVTPVAVPGPVLATVIVNPMLVPELTGVASAVLVMTRLGGFTTMRAKSQTVPALVAEAHAVLGSDPEVPAVVGLVMWMS